MQIHLVEQGQTINQIADLYRINPSVIIDANEIPEPYQLVVGQALVIPIIGQLYFVSSGESLYQIASKFGLSVEQLAQINQINPNQILNVGTRLYIPPSQKREIESNAYIEPFGETVSENLIDTARRHTPLLTYLTMFSYQVMRDGSLKEPPIDNLNEIANQNNALPMMAITNLENGQFSAELGRAILESEDIQDKLLDNIVKIAKEKGFRDIHFDFEFLPPEERENYLKFLRKAKDRLSREGLLMSVALAPKVSKDQKGEWYEAHDYEGVGQIADFVVLMTYEWGYSGGPPLPVSPINEVIKVVNYAVSEMPPSKILLGQNLYGYDWTLPYVEGGEFAKAISPQKAIELAKKYNQAIKYDVIAQAPHFDYTDEENKVHTVWFEDARSIQAKFNLIKRYGLRGISYWKLGLPFPQNWLLLEDNFNVVKK